MTPENSPQDGPGKARRRPLWRDPKRLWHERRVLAILLMAGAVAVAAGAVVGYALLKRPADVHNLHVAFKPEKPKKLKAKTVNWPIFGLNRARTRYLPAKGVKPPYRLLWHFTGRPLLEFPPVYDGGKLYFVNNNGTAFALDANTGKVLWERDIGRLNASSPAYYKHRLYIVNLVPGHVVKLDAQTGKIIWKRWLPGRAESSPLVVDNTLYFGCEDGRLFAVSTRNGHVRWTTTLGGPVKSAPAYYGGTLYVGVYAGNNDHRIYSYDRKTGALAWTHSTGGYVYSGPVVANTKHTGPTIYIGSFDGNIYALNAKSGETRWERSAGGEVVGSLSAVGEIVYVAEFSNGSTNGYDMRTGRQVFHYKTGTYSPVISDGRRLYLVGYSSINALQPYKYKAKVANRIVAPAVKSRPHPPRAHHAQRRH
jgi:outer membrane protein assembly factor BamB